MSIFSLACAGSCLDFRYQAYRRQQAREKARTDALLADPAKRAWAIERADFWIGEFIKAGIKVPDVRGQAIGEGDLWVVGEYGYDIWTVSRNGLQISVRGDGGFQGLYNDGVYMACIERGNRMAKDAAYATEILNSDIMTTESMRSMNETILRTIKHETWDTYQLRFESLGIIQQDRSRGISSGEFDGSYQYQGYINGLPCDGKSCGIKYDRVLGAPSSIWGFDYDTNYPTQDKIVISLEQAEEIAQEHIRDLLNDRNAETMTGCRVTKLTFPVVELPYQDPDYDASRPAIAHKVRVHWTSGKEPGWWYTDDVTVNALDGSILDRAHSGTVLGGPPENPGSDCGNFW